MLVFQFLMVRLKVNFPEVSLHYHLFQFLMVRLKAKLPRGLLSVSDISIPYSSIKSYYRVINKQLGFGLQFLMVRLKVRAQNFWTQIGIFQFLMVRLKVCIRREGKY